MQLEMNKQFKEEQKYTQFWFWSILLGLYLLPVLIYINKGVEDSLWSVVFISTILLFVLLIKRSTQIDASGIKMSFFPLLKKSITWNEIKSVQVIDYGFVGGWGIRFYTDYGTVYNIRGRIGLWIELTNGKKFVIGTQKKEELKTVLNNLGKISGK
jgi:hypothetical protein